MPPRRKRRSWSAEEDKKLTEAVQKYGERNWANIARGDFKNDRKASELSQRWANIRKKQGNVKVGSSSQLSETQLAAAHRAMSLALNMPMGDNLKAAGQISTDQKLGRAGPPKSQGATNRPSMSPISTPDSMVKAAAVAAGARIATSADASSLMEAARTQNVVHITTGGSSVIKSSTAGIANQLPSNVHFIRNGLAKAPISTYSAAKPNISRSGEAQQAQNHTTKSATSVGRPNPAGTPPALNVTSGLGNVTTSIPSAAALPKTEEDAVASASVNETKELVQGDQGANRADCHGCAPVERVTDNQSEEVEKHLISASGDALKESSQGHQASIPISDPVSQTQDDQVASKCSQVEDSGENGPDKQCASKESHENSGPKWEAA